MSPEGGRDGESPRLECWDELEKPLQLELDGLEVIQGL